MKIETIIINQLTIHEHHLDIIYGVDNFNFSTKVFYHDVSFSLLTTKYSETVINQIAAYIAFFEGMKLCSLFPKYYDISIIAEHLSDSALELFANIYQGVFAQHWYENNVTEYIGPEIVYPGVSLRASNPIYLAQDNSTVLAGCGGGKDSIVALKMLEEANLPFASIQYSHSIYGKADFQHNLISEVLEYVNPVKKHQISIYDDFIDYPLLGLYFPKNSGITVPETPVSIFECLPIMLNEGYRYLSLAHEKSANRGNFFWEKLGKEVNHQWGKSHEAEKLLNDFIQNNILANFTYFSILQPIYDFRIFKNLSQYPEVLPKIHSCNIKKPWCKKCPKCAYVWLGLMAAFEPQSVNVVFEKNLFDDEDLIPIFRQMLGLAKHTPFECIGEVDESRLAMKKCLEKGLSGKALNIFKQEILSDHSINWQEIEQKYDRVYITEHAIPDWIFSKIKEQL
ncbi:hypothetical protein Xen7305DRAFT_00009700 [Xenococcus sp. PCC 7305]|uniref:hypothetical protein n=1 Tax=Xenococcus sp. PCC 7305 TaxID=102125 RepID=UPI0002AC1D14|nr:hypothetical protein [Xenococcus sp. PCC 7305]ELS01267.1 hypothetical protein Xen7305DRAFT_00009700 [Xenococcus sp. PCC 7305]